LPRASIETSYEPSTSPSGKVNANEEVARHNETRRFEKRIVRLGNSDVSCQVLCRIDEVLGEASPVCLYTQGTSLYVES
jgi:hypothetical protein